MARTLAIDSEKYRHSVRDRWYVGLGGTEGSRAESIDGSAFDLHSAPAVDGDRRVVGSICCARPPP